MNTNNENDESEVSSGGWNFQLRPYQRWLNPISNLVIFSLFLGVECLLLFLLISIPELFHLYVPALLLVAWVQWKGFGAKSYEPMEGESVGISFRDNTMLYGVVGRELKIPLPLKIGAGVLGCRSVILGPGRGLPIPKNIAEDPIFVRAVSQSTTHAGQNQPDHAD